MGSWMFLFFPYAVPTTMIKELMHGTYIFREVSNYNLCNASNEGLYIPQIHTTNHGKLLLKYSAPVLWKALIKSESRINNQTIEIIFKNLLSFILLKLYIILYCSFSYYKISILSFVLFFIFLPDLQTLITFN